MQPPGTPPEPDPTAERPAPTRIGAIHALGPPNPAALTAGVDRYLEAARAPNTVRAYRSDWNQFVAWCQRHQATALPATAQTVAAHLADLAGRYQPPTIQRRLSAIGQAHLAAGQPNPTDTALVRETHRGIRRTHPHNPRQAEPLRGRDLATLVAAIDTTTTAGARDHALVLTGWWGALRRSELVAVHAEHLDLQPGGIALTVAGSKTDQAHTGAVVALPRHPQPSLDPVRALERWLDLAGIDTGPVFVGVDRHGNPRRQLSAQSVNLILKRHAETAGLTISLTGHSLRAGFATTAAEAGVSEHRIMNQTRHRSTGTVRRYVRDGELFTNSAPAQLAQRWQRRRPARQSEPVPTAEQWWRDNHIPIDAYETEPNNGLVY